MNPNEQIPYEIQKMIDSELSSGERVTWSGQPVPARLARKATPAVLFGIPWTAFAIFWTASAWHTTNHGKIEAGGSLNFIHLFFPLFGLPFVLVGLGILSSPYWAWRMAKRTAYVLTNKRAIVFASGLRSSVSVRSFEPEQLTDLKRNQNPDGSGDVVFTQDIRRDSEGASRSTDIGFLAVRDVKAVEDKVRSLAKQNREQLV